MYKDPAQPLYVTGSFDSVSGTYAFQGRRFDVVPTSSINFRGDLSPEVYVTVTRVISGVETRVGIAGPMGQPDLCLARPLLIDASTIEYYLSRILRLRATFSDAQSLNSRSPFRRVERAGIDLLFFFSFQGRGKHFTVLGVKSALPCSG